MATDDDAAGNTSSLMRDHRHSGTPEQQSPAPLPPVPRPLRHPLELSPSSRLQLRLAHNLPSPVVLVATTTPGSSRSSPRARHAEATPGHTPARLSPYPLRTRTPTQAPPQHPRSRGAHRRVSLSPSPPASERPRLELTLMVYVKSTIYQSDKTGRSLDKFVVSGASFTEIMRKLWDQYSGHVKHEAVPGDEGWSVLPPTFERWSRVMQFRYKKHPVPSERNEEAMNDWVASTRGGVADLLVYKYGLAIVKNCDLKEFETACIQVRGRDRAGAADDKELRGVIQQLQAQWGSTFRAETPRETSSKKTRLS